MAGLSSALAIASNALQAFSAGINVAGDNVSNSNTPGYIREQLDLSTAFPTVQGNLIFGNGVITEGIRQQIDKYLEKRIYSANSDFEGANAQSTTTRLRPGSPQPPRKTIRMTWPA